MKKKDGIIISFIGLVIAVLFLGYQYLQADKDIVVIYYHNEIVKEVDIHQDGIYTLTGDYGSFSLEVKDEQYRAIHVECPHHDCEKVGWVSLGSSKQIICLPNQIYVVQEKSSESIH